LKLSLNREKRENSLSDLLILKNLTSGYNGKIIIKDVNLSIKEGDIVAVIGPNGSGKSTLLKSIFNLAEIYKGQVVFNYEEITNMKIEELAKRGLYFLSQESNIFYNLKVKENIILATYNLDKKRRKEKIEELLHLLPELKDLLEKKGKELSGGQKQMLAFSLAILKDVKLLLLDEPTVGLSPKNINKVLNLIKDLNKKKGVTVILVEHNLKYILSFVDKLVGLKDGRIFFYKEKSEVDKNLLKKLYLD